MTRHQGSIPSEPGDGVILRNLPRGVRREPKANPPFSYVLVRALPNQSGVLSWVNVCVRYMRTPI